MSHEADKAGDKVDRWGREAKEETLKAGDRAEDAMYSTDTKVGTSGFGSSPWPSHGA